MKKSSHDSNYFFFLFTINYKLLIVNYKLIIRYILQIFISVFTAAPNRQEITGSTTCPEPSGPFNWNMDRRDVPERILKSLLPSITGVPLLDGRSS